MKKKVAIFCLIVLTLFACTGCAFGNFVDRYKVNITEYIMNLTLNDDHTLDGTQTVNYKNTTSNILNELYFHLYPNSFSATALNSPVSTLYESRAYPNGKSYGKIEINDVNIAGDDCSYSLENTDNDLLKVVLNTQLYPNDFVSVEISYKITIPNVLHRFGYNDNTINLGNIYPIACVFDGNGWDKNPYNANGDPFYSNLANYNVILTYPKDYILANTGTKTETTQLDDKQTTKIYAPAVRDFCMVLSKNFLIENVQIDNTCVEYFYYDDKNLTNSLTTIKKAMSTFNQTFGTYPYSTLAVVKTGFIYGGMEYPNLVMISDNLQDYQDYTNTIVHEIAHQWWYGLVGNNQFENAWLDESLAEYSTVIFYEQNPEYGIERETAIKNATKSYTMFVDIFEDVFNKIDTSMNRRLDQFGNEPEYVYAVYVRGMLMFDDVRNLVGDRLFFKSLQTYFEKYKGQNATPENLISVFENTAGKRIKQIFVSYIDGSAIIGELSK